MRFSTEACQRLFCRFPVVEEDFRGTVFANDSGQGIDLLPGALPKRYRLVHDENQGCDKQNAATCKKNNHH
jgi:hypothetical protein